MVDIPARERILRAVLELLAEGGVEAASTRAVSARAGVQAPALYRLFGDKDGLLEAAAERAMADWIAAKSTRDVPDDPVDALRAGWDDAVRFGLDHPDAYRIAYARAARGAAVDRGLEQLRAKVERVARAGRLTVTPERAEALLQASGRGVVLTLIDAPADRRDEGLAALAREAVIAAITTGAPARDDDLPATAIALRSMLTGSPALEPAERQLMDVWLTRIADAG